MLTRERRAFFRQRPPLLVVSPLKFPLSTKADIRKVRLPVD